jgi:hypothetical protein
MSGVPQTRFVGDTEQARNYAWFLTGAALAPVALVGILLLSWWRAQVYGWSENPRVPHAGDPFPWWWVAIGLLACVAVARIAVRQWRRYRDLVADDRRRAPQRS